MSTADAQDIRKNPRRALLNRVFLESDQNIPPGSLIEFKLRTSESEIIKITGFTEWSNDGSIADTNTGIAVKLIEMHRIDDIKTAPKGKSAEEKTEQTETTEQTKVTEPAETRGDEKKETSIPTSSTTSELLESLMGSKPELSSGTPVEINKDTPSTIASFILDDGSVKIVWINDLNSSIFIGSALAEIPPETANSHIQSKMIPDNVLENFQEVLNIGASLFNKPKLPHVSFDKVILSTDDIPEEIARLISNPGERSDFKAVFPEYGEGGMSILEKL